MVGEPEFSGDNRFLNWDFIGVDYFDNVDVLGSVESAAANSPRDLALLVWSLSTYEDVVRPFRFRARAVVR